VEIQVKTQSINQVIKNTYLAISKNFHFDWQGGLKAEVAKIDN